MKLHPDCVILGEEGDYRGTLFKIPALCEKKHKFGIRPSDLFHKGTWCPHCRGAKIAKTKTVLFSARIAQIMNLHPRCEVLTSESQYVDGDTDLNILCECGKTFQITFREIQSKRWCSFCKTKRTRETNLKKYGVEYISQVPSIALKASKKLNNPTTRTHWKTNEELVCQASYEQKTVDYFNSNKIDFEWQPKAFVMPDGKTYRPDAYLPKQDLWIEIKGWMRPDAKVKWDWFKSEHPTAELWDKTKLKTMGIL